MRFENVASTPLRKPHGACDSFILFTLFPHSEAVRVPRELAAEDSAALVRAFQLSAVLLFFFGLTRCFFFFFSLSIAPECTGACVGGGRRCCSALGFFFERQSLFSPPVRGG